MVYKVSEIAGFQGTAYLFRPLEMSDIVILSQCSSQTIVMQLGLQDEREVSPHVRLISQRWQLVTFAVFFCQVCVGSGVADEAFTFGVEFQSPADTHCDVGQVA